MLNFILVLCVLAVIVLFLKIQDYHRRTEHRLSKCERDRQEFRDELAELRARVHAGCSMPDCPLKEI